MDLSELFLWALAGTVLGAAFAVLAVRSRYAARLASASVERDVLRERVLDLESMLSADAEASALVAPLAASLDRVAAQVHTLVRDRGEQIFRVALVRVCFPPSVVPFLLLLRECYARFRRHVCCLTRQSL